jgi:hypothetical protein
MNPLVKPTELADTLPGGPSVRQGLTRRRRRADLDKLLQALLDDASAALREGRRDEVVELLEVANLEIRKHLLPSQLAVVDA